MNKNKKRFICVLIIAIMFMVHVSTGKIEASGGGNCETGDVLGEQKVFVQLKEVSSTGELSNDVSSSEDENDTVNGGAETNLDDEAEQAHEGEESATEVNIPISAANFPDPIFREYVKESFDLNGDVALSSDEINQVTWIDVSDRGIASLEGIGYFTNLFALKCYHNDIDTLDISKCTRLI